MNVSFRWLNQFTQSPEGKLWEGEGDPGAAAPSATPSAPAAPAASAPQAATPPASAQPPATGGPGEGRDGWVPSYRVRETREAALREAESRYQPQLTQAQQELATVRQQLQALAGVTPRQTTQEDQIRSQFRELFPELAKLAERAQDLEALVEQQGNLAAQTDHYWTTYGRQQMDRLFDHASQTFGSPLDDAGKRSIHAAFVGHVQSSPENIERYAKDPSFVDEYWRNFTSSFIDPARRAASATVATRAAVALPQDRPAGVPAVSSGPKPANLDERAAQAWAQYQTQKKD